jgi:hypothetical protein
MGRMPYALLRLADYNASIECCDMKNLFWEGLMAHNLYRFYLYMVCVALLIFAAVTLGLLLQTLLLFTPLRDQYTSIPTSAQVLQSVVLTVVSWLIAGGLGGVHYWLIRRDMNSDPTAGASAIRAFFLNIPEGLAVVVGVGFAGFGVIEQWAHVSTGGIVANLAVSLPAFLLALVLELERRRTTVGAGLALTFQRLHFYGVQLLLLIFLIFPWMNDFRPLVDGVILGGRGLHELCNASNAYGYCPSFNLFALFMTLLWFVGCWLAYGWLARNDMSAQLGLILRFVSFAAGIGFLIAGLYHAVTLLLYPLFHLALTWRAVSGPDAAHDFFSPFTLGLLIIGVYSYWLQRSVSLGIIARNTLLAIENAVAAGLLAASFWWGCGNLLLNAFETLVTVHDLPDAVAWISAIAFAVAGAAYIPLDVLLYRRNATEPTTAAGARRAFVLILLAAGILAAAVGGAVALYAWITATIGSPLPSWQQVAQTGLAAFIVGAILVGIYLPATIREHLFTSFVGSAASTTKAVTTTSAQEEAPSLPAIETILDELLAGKITRDVAAERIRALADVPLSTK